MTENKALIPVSQELSLEETIKLSDILFKSGFFSDIKQSAHAVVKILAGREIGIGPIASMTGIKVIKNSVAVGANIMATVVKADPRYDYRVTELTNERCEIVFFENGRDIGHSVFTIQDAQQAEVGKLIAPGASKPMLTRFTRNMLFSRAMSNGMRWYCPDATGGAPVYTPDELNGTIEPELDPPLTDDDLFDHKLDIAVTGETDIIERLEKRQERKAQEQPPMGKTEARPKKANGYSWPNRAVHTVLSQNLAKNARHAVAMLNMEDSKLTPRDALDVIIRWCQVYREARKAGQEQPEAVQTANDTALPTQEKADAAKAMGELTDESTTEAFDALHHP